MMRGDHIAEVAGLLLERELCTTAVPSSGSTISTDQGKGTLNDTTPFCPCPLMTVPWHESTQYNALATVYVKVRTGGSSADAQLMEYEAVGLKHLHDAATILRIPRPWLWGTLKVSTMLSAGTAPSRKPVAVISHCCVCHGLRVLRMCGRQQHE
jgi:hypothetical protein